MNNDEKLKLIYDDLANWMEGNDSDGSLEYSFRQGYYLHPINLWLSSGACSEDIYDAIEGVVIDRKEEMKEINQICDEADIFKCPDCNHHMFIDDVGAYHTNNKGTQMQCESCAKTTYLEKDGK
jgi:hypothetical protein